MARQVIILKQNLMGDWVDDEGNRYNDKYQRIDYLGRVIPEPWEEPAGPSFCNGKASIPEPKTLADFNNPYFFLHERAELQEEIDRLERAHWLQQRNWNCDWNEAPLQDVETQVPMEDETSEELEAVPQSVDILAETSLDDDIIKVSENYKGEVDEIERLLYAGEEENLGSKILSVDRYSSGVDRHLPKISTPLLIPEPAEPQHVHEPPVHIHNPLGSCKRKIPEYEFQPPRKKLKAYTGAVVIPAYLVDPGDTFSVYSKGPRPPPAELSAYQSAAYNIDPAMIYAVFHLGPRPP